MTLAALVLGITGTIASPAAFDWTPWGLSLAQVKSDRGSVTIYLPSDARAGDTISGSVFSEGDFRPATIEINGVTSEVYRRMFTADIPTDANELKVRVMDDDRYTVATIIMPLERATMLEPSGFTLPRVGVTRMPMKISGKFDGRRDTTLLEIDGNPVGVLAESPRSCVTITPEGRLGNNSIALLEDRESAEADLQCVKLTVTPPDRITIGRRAEAVVTIEGLSRVEDHWVEVSSDPKLVRFEKDAEVAKIQIRAADIKNGVWTGKVPFKAKKKGEIYLNARLIGS